MSTSAIAQYDTLPCALGGYLGPQAATPSPTLLAPSASLTLPSLANVQTRYCASDGTARLEAVISALLRAGAAKTPAFQEGLAKGFPDIGTLANHLFRSWVYSLDPNGCSRYLEFAMGITDYSKTDWSQVDLDDSVVVFESEATECACLRLSDVLLALNKARPGLGNAFYRQLVDALTPMSYFYGEDEARGRIEMLIEGFEMDKEPEESVEEFMAKQDICLPDVGHARPAWLPEWKCPSTEDTTRDCALLSGAGNPKFQEWCDAVLELGRLRRRSGYDVRYKDAQKDPCREIRDLWDDGRPLPHWVLYFEEHDAIVQMFDEEQAYFYETSHEPDFLAVARCNNPAELDDALRWFADYFRFQCILMGLVRSIHAWQKK